MLVGTVLGRYLNSASVPNHIHQVKTLQQQTLQPYPTLQQDLTDLTTDKTLQQLRPYKRDLAHLHYLNF